MFCSKCGVGLNGGSLFCHTCGNKVQQMAAVDAVGGGIAPEQAALFPENEPVAEQGDTLFSTERNNVPPEVNIPSPDSEAPLPEKIVSPPETVKKEKISFGLPALIFCLVIIGLLSVACGVLAMLYFGGFEVW
ncbi:MAG: hypothetical protein FWG70_00020 [Oscillospiraceae bacterium]|nr:hypothetical protein [Oscillospiraceae bacterium]